MAYSVRSCVVTGGGRGIGRAVAERLAAGGGAVVVIELDPAALDWTAAAAGAVAGVAGDARDEAVTGRAAEVAGLIQVNLQSALAGCRTAIGRFLTAGTPGAIVNVSSHQAQRAVRGAFPYATAKAATEGLTRALAVDYGPRDIRVNAVALGTIATERYAGYLAGQPEAARARTEADIARLQPAGRPAR